MAKTINKLTAATVKSARYEGKEKKLFDGLGLHLHVKQGGKYWRLSYPFRGKRKLLALGVYPQVSLARARELRDENRNLLDRGVDPSAHRKAIKAAGIESAANTFKVLALEWYQEVH